MRKLTSIVLFSIITALVGLPMASVLAADSYWDSSSGNFSDVVSWEAGGIPGVGDDAHFTNGATYSVKFTSDATCENAYFDAPSGEVSIDALGYKWTLDSGFTVADTMRLILAQGELTTSGDNTITTGSTDPNNVFTVGNSGASYQAFKWNITGGTTTITTAGDAAEGKAGFYIGNNFGRGAGIMNVSGADTVVTNSGNVYLGRYTFGTLETSLTVSGGSKFYVGNDFSMARSCNDKDLTVTGSGSLVSVGGNMFSGTYGDDSTVTVSDGAKLKVGGIMSPSAVDGERDGLLLTGEGTELECGQFRFAYAGSGDCWGVISNGASLTVNGDFFFGTGGSNDAHDNTFTVTGEGTVVTQSIGNIYWSGVTNNFYVLDGAMVWLDQADSLVPGSTNGRLLVSGTNTFMSLSRLYAVDGQTTTVSNGATLTIRTDMYLGLTGLPGYVEVTGSNSLLSVPNNRPCHIGDSAGGTAYFTVSNGGRFEHNYKEGWDTTVGTRGHGIVAITGEGSTFAANQFDLLLLGYLTGGNGEITVEDKGLLKCHSVMICDQIGTTGTVTVVGSGVWTNTGNVTVGGYSDDGNSKATMAFVLDKTGVSTVQVDGNLTVRPSEAYLTVDLSNYHREAGSEFVLVECGSLNGTFDDDKISVIGLNGGVIEQDTVNDRIVLTVNDQPGTLILIN